MSPVPARCADTVPRAALQIPKWRRTSSGKRRGYRLTPSDCPRAPSLATGQLDVLHDSLSFALFYAGFGLAGGLLALYRDKPVIVIVTAAGGAFVSCIGKESRWACVVRCVWLPTPQPMRAQGPVLLSMLIGCPRGSAWILFGVSIS